MSTDEAAAKIRAGSSFDEMTGGAGEAPAEESTYVPRVIYTTDAKPDPKKISVPMLRIAQGMTQEVTDRVAQVGQFVLTNFPAQDRVILVPLGAQDIRVYKPDPKQHPKCQAPTGTFGVGDPGGLCADCPLGKWGAKNPATGKSTPPRCKEGISLRAYSVTHRCMVDFMFLGRTVGKGAFIQQQAMAFGYGNFAIALKTAATKNDLGAWFEPEIVMEPEIPEDHKPIVATYYEIFRAGVEHTAADAVQMLKAGETDKKE